MFWYRAFRWLLFFLVGLPFQLCTYSIYPLLVLYFWFFVRAKRGTPLTLPTPIQTPQDLVQKGLQSPIRDQWYLDIPDDDGCLIHAYFWRLRPDLALNGIYHLVTPSGSMARKYPVDTSLPVAGDMLAMWVASAVKHGCDLVALKKLAWNYLANCLGLSALSGRVSARSSVGGVNYVPDGWLGLNQPCLAMGYWNSAALFALAAKRLGGPWHLVYWLHWLVMGGWLWWLAPFVSAGSDPLYYVQHIAVVNLSSLLKLTGNPIYKYALRYILRHCGPVLNRSPALDCWAADAGALTKTEIEYSLQQLSGMAPFLWPQNTPLSMSFYSNSDTQLYGVIGGCAKMLLDAQARLK